MIKYQMINPLQIQIYPYSDNFCFHLNRFEWWSNKCWAKNVPANLVNNLIPMMCLSWILAPPVFVNNMIHELS